MATVLTTATGRATGEPDRAEIRLAVEARADDPATARGQAASAAEAVRTALGDLDLADDAVRTAGFDVRRRQRHPEGEDGDPEYEATYTYQVDLADVDRVGPVIDAAVDAGVTGVDRLRFAFSEARRRDLRATALEDAMRGARAQAEVVADSEGLAVTEVEAVETRDGGGGPPGRQLKYDAAGEAEAGTAVDPGSMTVSETVEVTYETT